MGKFIPVGAESSRLLDPVKVQLKWYLPWACWSCRAYGAVEVVIEQPHMSTDAEVMDAEDRDHHARTQFCLRLRANVQHGRVYRLRPSGEKIYLRGKDEREEDIRSEAWPPWVDR